MELGKVPPHDEDAEQAASPHQYVKKHQANRSLRYPSGPGSS